MSADEQKPEPGEHVLEAESLFGYKTREALVQFNLDGKPFIQIRPNEARDFAAKVMLVAEAADQDGFIISFAVEKIGLSENQAAHLLAQFRDARKDYDK